MLLRYICFTETLMYISYDYYRIFYYVAKYGSFTRAAEILIAGQPNLTRAVKTLETQLGCTLFSRSNKGVKLTSEGEKLYEHIRLAVEHIQAGEDEISHGKDLRKGVVSVGATEIALRCFLLPMLNEFRDKYPEIRIKILNLSTPQALALLKGGTIDIAVVTTPAEKSSELSQRIVKSFGETAVCGKAYFEKLGNDEISLQNLVEYPIISLERGSGTYGFYDDLFKSSGASFSPVIEVATADQILPMVKHNLGIGFVPEEFLREDGGEVYRVNLIEDIPKRNICVVTNRTRRLSLPAEKLGLWL